MQWMLGNGFIKCQNTGKKNKKYTVQGKDLPAYIADSAKHAEKHVTLHAKFSTVKHNKSQPRKLGFPPALSVSSRAWLEAEFEEVLDALTVPQVVVVTGYTDNAINRRLRLI